MADNLLIFGAGGHGKVVADAAEAAGWHVCGFADDRAERRGQRVLSWPIVAIGQQEAIAYARQHGAHLVVAVGDNYTRFALFLSLVVARARMATVVHPSAVVAASASLNAGSVILAGAIIGPDATVGSNAIINHAAAVDHDSVVGNHAHLAPGARTGGTAIVGDGTMLGIGACLRNNTRVGDWSMVGMGAVVVADIPDRVLAFGNPARIQGPYEAKRNALKTP